jgi:hypothetical protein
MKKDYGTEEKARTQQRAVEPLLNECLEFFIYEVSSDRLKRNA